MTSYVTLKDSSVSALSLSDSFTPPAIDYGMFPHVIDAVLCACDLTTLLTFRLTCKAFANRVDDILFHHVAVSYVGFMDGRQVRGSRGKLPGVELDEMSCLMLSPRPRFSFTTGALQYYSGKRLGATQILDCWAGVDASLLHDWSSLEIVRRVCSPSLVILPPPSPKLVDFVDPTATHWPSSVSSVSPDLIPSGVKDYILSISYDPSAPSTQVVHLGTTALPTSVTDVVVIYTPISNEGNDHQFGALVVLLGDLTRDFYACYRAGRKRTYKIVRSVSPSNAGAEAELRVFDALVSSLLQRAIEPKHILTDADREEMAERLQSLLDANTKAGAFTLLTHAEYRAQVGADEFVLVTDAAIPSMDVPAVARVGQRCE